jgi:hypothetical protein
MIGPPAPDERKTQPMSSYANGSAAAAAGDAARTLTTVRLALERIVDELEQAEHHIWHHDTLDLELLRTRTGAAMRVALAALDTASG